MVIWLTLNAILFPLAALLTIWFGSDWLFQEEDDHRAGLLTLIFGLLVVVLAPGALMACKVMFIGFR